MRGRRALWIPGADHAGFETQVVYDKKLEKEGRSRFKLERGALYIETQAKELTDKLYYIKYGSLIVATVRPETIFGNDFEIAARHKLPSVEVIDQFGKLNEKTGKYRGLNITEARARVVSELHPR